MFKVKSLVLDFFILALGIMLELTLDTCHKSLEITWVPIKEKLNIFSGYKDILLLVDPVARLVLSLSEVNISAEEKDPKQDAIGPSSLSVVKIIFALLAKMVIIHM